MATFTIAPAGADYTSLAAALIAEGSSNTYEFITSGTYIEDLNDVGIQDLTAVAIRPQSSSISVIVSIANATHQLELRNADGWIVRDITFTSVGRCVHKTGAAVSSSIEFSDCNFQSSGAGLGLVDIDNTSSRAGMTMTGCSFEYTGGGIGSYGVYYHGGTGEPQISITDCDFVALSKPIYATSGLLAFAASRYIQVYQCAARGCDELADTNCPEVDIQNCYAYLITNNGVIRNTNSVNLSVQFCTFHDVGTNGIFDRTGAPTGSVVKNCIFSDCVNVDVIGDWDYNCVYSTAYTGAPGANDITGAPLFVDSTSGDFRLQWYWEDGTEYKSPCITAGVDVSIVVDYAGLTRPQLLLPDIGAHEYIGGGISNAYCTDPHTILVTFLPSPSLVPIALSALNPYNWTFTNFEAVDITAVDSLNYQISSRTTLDDDVTYTVDCSEVGANATEDASVNNPGTWDVIGFHIPQEVTITQQRELHGDIRVSPIISGTVPSIMFPVTSSGDLDISTQTETIKQRIWRRLVTRRGEMSWAPEYGLSISLKSPMVNPYKLKDDIKYQVKLEPGVEDCSVSLELTTGGILNVELMVRTDKGVQNIQYNITV